MTAFYIAPYHPGNWTSAKSDLRIDPDWYKKCLSDNWIGIKFYSDEKSIPLAWDTPTAYSGVFVYGILHNNLQVVSLDAPFEEFFLWHRKIISNKYDLYLFNDSSPNKLKLISEITIEDIRMFCGKKP